MCKPHRCPHINVTGNICIYCPGGPDSDFEYSTQSYTGYEPTSMRAIRARYDPYLQTRHRVEQLQQLGHTVDKVEFIVMGGTFMSLPDDYRDYFIRNLHDALSGHKSSSVSEAVKYSERSRTKCIGITIETRPDFCQKRHLSDMLNYGCTRLEIGVQSVYEDIAKNTNRGHTVQACCDTFHLAKDCGFKVVTHMMPNLPNVDLDRDVVQFKEFFESPRFRADGLKIYPTLVIRGTGLYELWKTGRYKSYPPSTLVDLVAHILSLIPPWCRVYRVQRDIPMPLVSSGVEYGNLRELALERMADLGLKCRDVRTREVGINEIHRKIRPYDVEPVRRDYYANGGWETFLSYEDPEQDILIGLLRLRKVTKRSFRSEIPRNSSIIRELHVYGSAVPVHARDVRKFQHQGFGTLLMEWAEEIAEKEHESGKILVISGVGTRDYYRKLGYEIDGPYMSKTLRPIKTKFRIYNRRKPSSDESDSSDSDAEPDRNERVRRKLRANYEQYRRNYPVAPAADDSDVNVDSSDSDEPICIKNVSEKFVPDRLFIAPKRRADGSEFYDYDGNEYSPQQFLELVVGNFDVSYVYCDKCGTEHISYHTKKK